MFYRQPNVFIVKCQMVKHYQVSHLKYLLRCGFIFITEMALTWQSFHPIRRYSQEGSVLFRLLQHDIALPTIGRASKDTSTSLPLLWANKQAARESSLISTIVKSRWEPPPLFHPQRAGQPLASSYTLATLEPVRWNLPKRIRYAWRDLTINPRFYLMKADRRRRLVMWSREDYSKKTLR